MLELPDKGISPSINVHNCDLITVVDWVLASVLFCEEDVSRTDLLDTLMDNQVYRDQDFCQEFVASVWQELSNFISDIDSPCLTYEARAVRIDNSWRHDYALSFCVAASLRAIYTKWSKESCGDYNEQGYILERLTKLSLSSHHPNIEFKNTGWSGVDTNEKFSDLVAQICSDGNFVEKNLSLWDSATAKDMGLDVYGYFFNKKRRRPSAPFMVFQCASGKNWTEKRGTPNLDIWGDIIQFFSKPIRGMAIPFIVNDEDFQRSLILLNGPLLDRGLLLSGIKGNDVLEGELQGLIDNWVCTRTRKLEHL